MPDTQFFTDHNARHVFHPMGHPAEIQSNPPRIICKGEGVFIEDEQGNRVVDAVGGLWNVNLGYSCEPIKQAIAEQLAELPYYSSFRGTTTPGVIELSERLTQLLAPEKMRRAFFTSGGSDSIETALRLARQYWKVQGQRDRYKFMSFKKGYHGTHFGGASINGSDRFRRGYEPMLPGCIHVLFPALYRNPLGATDPEALAEQCLALIEDEIKFQNADTIAAFIAEPVLGAGGVYPPPPNLWPGLRALCDKYDILLIADEVITGFGRAGDWFGSRVWGVAPDIICLAKAITSGYFPLGAVMLNEKLETAFMQDQEQLAAIYHGYTYSGHPVGCAAALTALDETFKLDLPGNSLARGEQIMNRMQALQDEVEIIGEVRGRGLMVGIELVSDRDAKTPLSPQIAGAIGNATFEAGVFVRISGNIIILSPPLILSASEADQICDALEVGLKSVSL